MPSNSPLALDDETTYLSTNNLENKAVEEDKEPTVHGSKESRLDVERNEFSSTFGLTAEETREFWDMILPEETGIGKAYHIKSD